MAFWQKWFQKRSEITESDIQGAINKALLDLDSAPLDITEESALAISTVWACVSLLSESVGILPIHLYKKTDNGREVVTKHPAYQICNYPNDYLTRLDLMQHLIVSVTLWGNGYARIIRKQDNVSIKKIQLLSPCLVRPILLQDDTLMYQTPAGIVEQSDIIHIKGLVVDGVEGKSPIRVHRENLALTMQVQTYGERFFSKGGNVDGIFEYPGTLKEENFKRLQADIVKKYTGIGNSHMPMLLEGGMKYSRINIPLEDAQFLTTRKFQKGEIASIYRVPPHMVGDLERSTNNNIEQQAQEYLTYCLMPYLVKIESELNRKLLRTDELGTYFFKFGLNGLLRADSKSRSEYYKNMNLIGCLSANEIRELEEMNGYSGGDKFFVQQNMQTVENAKILINEQKETNE